MSADIRRILNAPDKLVHETDDVLARLFRKILFDSGMTEYHWQTRMRRYLDDPTNRIPNNPNARSSARGNLNKELASRKMSWNVFNKGIKFLGPQWVRFKLEIGWNPNRVTYHQLDMSVSTPEQAPAQGVQIRWPNNRTTYHSVEPRGDDHATTERTGDQQQSGRGNAHSGGAERADAPRPITEQRVTAEF